MSIKTQPPTSVGAHAASHSDHAPPERATPSKTSSPPPDRLFASDEVVARSASPAVTPAAKPKPQPLDCFSPTSVTPIIPGQPLPNTIVMDGVIEGRPVSVQFPLLDPTKPMELTFVDHGERVTRPLLVSEARALLHVLAERFIAKPEQSVVFDPADPKSLPLIPVLDRLGMIPGLIEDERPAKQPSNSADRVRQALALGLTPGHVDRDGLRYSYVDSGDRSKPAVILVAGYPDSWHSWRKQIPELMEQGYRVIAIDLPGFGDSGEIGDVADPVQRYNHRVIAGDLNAVIDQLGATNAAKAKLVTHDWGAVFGWDLAGLYPDKFDKLVAMTVGHPAVYVQPEAPVVGLNDVKKMWYHLLFANSRSGVADWLLRQRDWALFERMMGPNSEADMAYWKRDLSQPGALRASRQLFVANSNNFATPDFTSMPPVQCDTLGLFSNRDEEHVSAAQMELSKQLVTPGHSFSFVRVASDSHWAQLDAPEHVNAQLRDFFGPAGK